MSLLRVRWAVAAASCIVFASCSDGGGTTNPPATGDFGVTLSATTLTVVQGATATLTATIARTNAFAATVDISTENVPAGITASFSPSAITSGTTATTLTVTAAASVAAGAYNFTIRGHATGASDKTAQVTLTVTAAPRIALAILPAAGTVVQGNSTAIATTLTRTNFAGAVALAVTGAPTGVTTAVSTNGDAGTVTVNVGATAAPGTYTLTVTATGTGVAAATASYALTVTAAPLGTYALALSPNALIVLQGANGQSTVTITRTSFTAPIALAVTGAPAGVTTAFGQSTLNTESTTTLTVSVDAAVAAGSYPLTVTATSGATTHTAVLTLSVTAAPVGSIALALSAPNATVNAGSATTFTVNITRTSFTGDVAVALTGVPSGVTPTITTSPTAGNSVQVQLAVGAGVAPGSYAITVTASGTGIANVTTPFTLNVTAVPAIALSSAPTGATVQQGNNTAFTVTIARTNFVGNVTLAVTGAPAGVTTSVATSPTAGNSAQVTVTVGGATAAGVYPLTVTGSGTGLTNATTTFALTVTPAPSGSGNVTWTFGFCGAGDIPVWLAAQDGSGAWQRVVGANNAYSFTITSAGGVAYVTQNGANDYDVNFYFGSLAEMQGRGTTICPTALGKTVNGTVANYGTSTFAMVSLGAAFAQVVSPTTSFQLTDVQEGTVDLVAARSGIDFGNPQAGLQMNKLIIRRGLNPAAGSTLPVLDFNAGEAFDPDHKTLTIAGGAGGEQLFGGVSYFTANQGFAILSSGGLASNGVVTYPAVPSARQVATDLHIVTAIGSSTTGGAASSSRILTSAFKDATDKSVTLPSALATPTFSTLAAAPYLRTRVQLARQGEYGDYWVLGYGQSGRSVSVQYSAAYLGASAVDFSFPDFGVVAGWQNVWGPVSGAQTTWNVSASGWTLGGGGFSSPYIEGTVIRSGARTGEFTP